MEAEKKNVSKTEIDASINNIKGIWAIENMGMTEEEEEIHRAYLAGEITEEENNAHFFEQKK